MAAGPFRRVGSLSGAGRENNHRCAKNTEARPGSIPKIRPLPFYSPHPHQRSRDIDTAIGRKSAPGESSFYQGQQPRKQRQAQQPRHQPKRRCAAPPRPDRETPDDLSQCRKRIEGGQRASGGGPVIGKTFLMVAQHLKNATISHPIRIAGTDHA